MTGISTIDAKIAQLHTPENKKTVHEAAVKFESMFLNEMFSHMFSGLETDGSFGGGQGEEIFRSMMIEQYGQKVAGSKTTGISTSIEREMLRMQEEQLNPRGNL